MHPADAIHSSSAPLRGKGSLLAAFAFCSSLGCTAILTPRDDVERCDAVDDCTPIEDTRYAPECTFPPEGPGRLQDADKICVADYVPLRCDPSRTPGPGHPLFDLYEALRVDRSRLQPCDASMPAPRGCPRSPLGCQAGLLERPDGICDVELAPPSPAYPASALQEPAQDVLDAYCQSFFCDDRFVCDAGFCEPCDPAEPWGEGGCGRVFSNGAPSCVYVADVEEACRAPDADPDAPVFGGCPPAS